MQNDLQECFGPIVKAQLRDDIAFDCNSSEETPTLKISILTLLYSKLKQCFTST